MATEFKKGDVVRLKTVVPQGPVLKIRMTDEGEVEYLVEYRDANDATQQRWFKETELEAA